MQFILNEEQSLLNASVSKLIEDLSAKQDKDNISSQRKEMAEFGLFSLFSGSNEIDEIAVETGIISNAIGKQLHNSYYSFSFTGAAQIISRYNSKGHHTDLLEAIGLGAAEVAPAIFEPGYRYDLHPNITKAKKTAAGYQIDGRKSVVVGADTSSHLLVSAIDEDGELSLFVIPVSANGVTLRKFETLDQRSGAQITLDGVSLPSTALVAVGAGALEELNDRINAALCAEAVGIMEALLEICTEFLQTRNQFGGPIGRFQVLQHRLVDMNTAFELAKSMGMAAALAVNTSVDAERSEVISAAKVQVSESARLVGQHAIQLNGAMGMTAEYSVGRYVKRLIVLMAAYGDADSHLDRFTESVLG